MRLSTRFFACALLTALCTHCGGTAPPARTPAPLANTATVSAPTHEPPPDVSPVPAPDALALVLLAPSTVQLAARLESMVGAPLALSFDALFAAFDFGRPGVIDRDAPVELLYVDRDHQLHEVISLGALATDSVRRALSAEHHFVALSNGVLRIEDPHESTEGAQAPHYTCRLAPTPRADRTRLVCGQDAVAVDTVLAYAARTLSTFELPADTLVAEGSPTALHVLVAPRWTEALDALAPATTPAPTPGTASNPLRALVDGLRPLFADATGARGEAVLHDDRADVTASLSLHTPSTDVLRALDTALRAAPAPSPDLFQHLLPNGWLYFGGTLDLSALRATYTALTTAATAWTEHDATVAAPDRTALNSALASIPLGATALAFSGGHDEIGIPWLAGTLRMRDVPPALFVTRVRALLAALRRPAIVRALGTSDLTTVREMPAAGLPRGAVGIRFAVGAPARGPHGEVLRAELHALFVPMGTDLVVIFGDDVRDLFARYRANTHPGLDPQTLAPQGHALAAALVPAGLVNMLRGQDVSRAVAAEMMLTEMADHGMRPVVLRVGTESAEGGTRVSFDGTVPATTLRAYLQLAFAGQASRGR